MRWLLWGGWVLGLLALVATGLRVLGARRWAALSAQHRAQLESGRATSLGVAPSPLQRHTRFDERELEGLPAPVQRYFRAVLQDGQPIIAAARIEMAGTMNLSSTAEQWKPFTSHQNVVTSVNGSRPGFLWDARVRMFPGMPLSVEDSYIVGQGQLIAKLLGMFTVAHARGGGELARGEFMRYFAEAPWYPTALLPSQGVQWQSVDDLAANATIHDGSLALTLLIRFNEAGLIVSVRAESRGAGSSKNLGKDMGKDMVMLPWECAFSNYQSQAGMRVPMSGEAAWVRPEGRWVYFKGQVANLSWAFEP